MTFTGNKAHKCRIEAQCIKIQDGLRKPKKQRQRKKFTLPGLKNPQLKCLNHWWEREWKHFLSGVQLCLRLHPVAVIHVCCQTISSIVRSDPENESEICWKSHKNYPESFLSQTKTWNRGLFHKKWNLAFFFFFCHCGMIEIMKPTTW